MPKGEGAAHPRAVVVGAGLMGGWHARYGTRQGARLVAVVDKDLNAAQRLAARFGAQALGADSDWLAQTRPDVVHVCTPWFTHVELCRAALQAGASVIVEKPVADTLAAARALASLAAEKGLLVVPVHQFPFQAGFQRLRAELGGLGTLRSVEFVTFTAGAGTAVGAARRKIALEILPHVVSLFHALGFPIAAEGFALQRFTDDVLELSWQSGPTRLSGRIDLCARPTCNELRVAGDDGTALADLFHGYVTFDRAEVGRASKLLRPFRASSKTLLGAGANLVGRAWRREPAYPGLSELIGRTYRALAQQGPLPIPPAEYCIAAALNERLLLQS
jgi:predicted dehydrogenase